MSSTAATAGDAGPTTPTPPKAKPSLTGVSETMLVVLAARAEDAVKPNPVLHDTFAAETLARLDYAPPRGRLDHGFFATVLLRASLLDAWAAEFLAAHPGATVLHLGCGLDSRALRLGDFWCRDGGGGAAAARWYDVDMPAVVALRRRVMAAPEGGDYHLVEASVTDDAWLEAVPADRPTLVVMEGLLGYLEPHEAQRLVHRIAERFPSGQLVFDAIGGWFLRMQRFNRPISRTGAVLRSSVDDPREISAVHAKLELRSVVRIWEVPGREILPWYLRLSLWVYSWIPGMRTAVSYFRYNF